MLKRLLGLVLALALAPAAALAQGSVQQAGPIVPYHVPVWVQNGQVADAGTPAAPLVSQLGLFNGQNCPFGISSQTTPGLSTTPGAALTICQTSSTTTFTVTGTNGNPAPAVFFNIGGTLYPFPGSGSGNVVGPNSSAVGEGACFNNTSGTLLTGCDNNVTITRAQIPTTLIGANETISVVGYRTPGDLGAGQVYSSVNCLSTGIGEIADSGGTPFCLVMNGRTTPGAFGAYADNGSHTISSGDIAANPQWRWCYVAGQTWDFVGLQESIVAAFAPASTPAAAGCTPTVAPISPPNIAWNAVTASYSKNSTLNIPVGNFGIATTLTMVASHFTMDGGGKGATLLNWKGTFAAGNPGGPIIYCDYCSYMHSTNIGMQVLANQTYGSTQAALVFDADGTYAALKPQQVTLIDFFCVVEANGGCILDGLSGSGAQGDTFTLINPLFVSFYGAYCVRLNGDNELSLTIVGGDAQGFSYDCIAGFGSTVHTYGFHFENQNAQTRNTISPYLNQMLTGGADVHSYGGVSTEECDSVSGGRAEDNVLAVSAPGHCVDVTSSEVVSTDVEGWAANAFFFPRGSFALGNPPGVSYNRAYVLVSTGGQDNPSAITSVTANTLTDSTQSWSVNQWAGFELRFRFGSNGFTIACTIASNTATVLTLTTNCLSPPAAATSMYVIQGSTGGTTPTWTDGGYNSFGAGSAQGFATLASSNQVGVGSVINSQISVGDWVVIPNAANIVPGTGAPTFGDALYGQVTAKSGSPCPGGQVGGACLTLSATAQYTVLNALGYYGTPITDGADIWIPFRLDTLAGVGTADGVRGVFQIGYNIGSVRDILQNIVPLIDVTGGQGARQGPGAAVKTFTNGVLQGCTATLPWSTTVDLTTTSMQCNTLLTTVSSNGTINAPVVISGMSQPLHLQLATDGNFTVTLGSNITVPPGFSAMFQMGTVNGKVFDLFLQSSGLNGWVEVAGPNQVVNGLTNVPARVSTHWYAGFSATNAFTTASTTTTYFAPLYIASPVTITALGVTLTTGQSGGDIQLALYPDSGSGVPLLTGGPLAATANITATASTTNVNGAVTALPILAPGLYWASVMSNNTGIVILGLASTGQSWAAALAGASSQNGLVAPSTGIPINGYTLTGQTFGTWPTSGSPAVLNDISGPALQYKSQ